MFLRPGTGQKRAIRDDVVVPYGRETNPIATASVFHGELYSRHGIINL